MFIQQKHVFQGTASFHRGSDSYNPAKTGHFFRPFKRMRNGVAYYEYVPLHMYVYHKDANPGTASGNQWFRWELYDHIEFDPDEVIVPEWWTPESDIVGYPLHDYERCSLGWNLMSDGAWVMDTALGSVTEQAWLEGPLLPATSTLEFRGALYDCCILDCGDGETPTSESDWQRYIADSGDATEEAWGVENAITVSGYRGGIGVFSNRVWARRLDYDDYMQTSWYCKVPGVVYGAVDYQAPYRWVLKPSGDAPVITPDQQDLGRLVGTTSFDISIATDASLVVNVDGGLVVEMDVSAGESAVDLSGIWDALAPGWHDLHIVAVNEAGYQCAAKRSFVKAFGEVADGSEREGLPPRYVLYSRWGRQLGDLELADVRHRQEINGEDSLDFSAGEVLAKGDRILWHDGRSWREHAVVGIEQSHRDVEEASYHCETTMMCDLDAKQLESFSAKGTAVQTLSSLLQGTPWSVGSVDIDESKSADWEKKSAYEVLMECAGLYGAEVYPTVECDAGGVVYRKVNFVKKMGEDKGARFEYASNLDGVTKTVLDDAVYSAVKCYGAEGVTGYVANEDAKLLWGLPDGRGGVMHTVGRFEDSSIDSVSGLLEAGKAWLEQHMTPQVEYATNIPFAELEGVQLGDTVQVRDKDFTPTLRIFARVGSMERDLSSGETSSVSFGNVVSVLPDVLARQFDSIRLVQTALGGITAESMMQGMNAVYASGGSYVCMTAEGGIITANVPLNADGSPTVTEGALSAVQMSAGRVRTATSVDEDGKWEWEEVQLSGGSA